MVAILGFDFLVLLNRDHSDLCDRRDTHVN
jgi:hypothetical protein